MNNIFIGFLLVFLDFNLNLGACTIGLIPDFAGYLVMLKGLDELSGAAAPFAKIRPFALGMAIYTGVLYALDLFALSASLGGLSTLLGIIATVISLYISYTIIAGVRELEALRCAELGSARLQSAWTAMAVLQAATLAALLLPALALLCIIAGFVASVAFLVAFHSSKKLYEALPRSGGPDSAANGGW